MKRHFRRFGSLYATLFILAAWPVFLLRMQAVPPPDEATLERLDRAIEQEFWRQHPELNPHQFKEEEALRMPATGSPEETSLNRIMAMLPAAAAPALAPDLDRVAAYADPMLKTWDALTSRGVTIFSSAPQFARSAKSPSAGNNPPQGNPQGSPNYLGLQNFNKLRRVQANRAIQEGRWTDALQCIQSCARMGDPVHYDNLIGCLLAIAARHLGYMAYADLLHAGPPPEIARAALEQLVSLRASDPVLDEWVWLSERHYVIRMMLARLRREPGTEQLTPDALGMGSWLVYGLAQNLSRDPGRIQDPALRARAEAVRKCFTSPNNDIDFIPAPYAALRWTTVPSMRKWLLAMMEKEQVMSGELITDTLGFQPAEARRLDPWTLMMFMADRFSTRNFQEAAVRGQVAKTRGRLLEAAFAARLFQNANGRWPASMAELSSLIPPLPASESTLSTSSTVPTSSTFAAFKPENLRGFQTNAFLPLQIASRAMTPELSGQLWSEVLPLRAFDNQTGQNAIQGNVLDYIDTSEEFRKEPVRLLAIQQAFQAHPALVQGSQAYLTWQERVGWGPGWDREGDRLKWEPLQANAARAITAESDRLHESAARQRSVPPDPAAPKPPEAFRFQARLRAPKQAVVIWSPGPDGKDDGGTIGYDPSNGTISRGDLIVFPEKY